MIKIIAVRFVFYAKYYFADGNITLHIICRKEYITFPRSKNRLRFMLLRFIMNFCMSLRAGSFNN